MTGRHVCAALDMPPEKVRIIQPPMGRLIWAVKDGITFQTPAGPGRIAHTAPGADRAGTR